MVAAVTELGEEPVHVTQRALDPGPRLTAVQLIFPFLLMVSLLISGHKGNCKSTEQQRTLKLQFADQRIKMELLKIQKLNRQESTQRQKLRKSPHESVFHLLLVKCISECTLKLSRNGLPYKFAKETKDGSRFGAQTP